MQQLKEKRKKASNSNHSRNPEQNKKPTLRIICIEEREDSQLKGSANTFNKIIEENFLNIKRMIPINM